MTDPRLARLASDDVLAAALVDLGRTLAMPDDAPGPSLVAEPTMERNADPAGRARARIELAGAGAALSRPRAIGPLRRPARRALVLGLAAALALAAVAGAIGFGLPGIRIVFGPGVTAAPSGAPTLRPSEGTSPSTSATPGVASGGASRPSANALGSSLGLGAPIDLAEAPAIAGTQLLLPPADRFGPPAAAWNLESRISLVWPSSVLLPELREPGVGLILGEFRGSIDPGYFEKILEPGTEISAVIVNDQLGWWIAGEPHELVFVDSNGEPVFDSHRIVGDTLIWSDGSRTFRLESALGRPAAIALAESLR
jgi:hypothetical protein